MKAKPRPVHGQMSRSATVPFAPVSSPAPTPDAQPPTVCDVVVVGAGILGLATARELMARHSGMRVAVLEREGQIARHQTGSSSGVIHAGIYYEPGSLKARLCVEGARELYAYCDEHGIAAERNGKLVIAVDDAELGRLAELERRGRENGVPGLRRLDASEIREVEPYASGVAALHSPATGVVDFATVAASFARDVTGAGGTITTACGVRSVNDASGGVRVEHERGSTEAGFVIGCAGAWSDRLAVAAGAEKEPRIVPFRGAYLRLRPSRRDLVRANIYPVPDPELPFLGAHLTRGIDGEVLLGPTALMVGARDAYRLGRLRASDLASTLGWPGTWKLVARHWRSALAEIGHAASRRSLVATMRGLVPELGAGDFVRGPAGVRAQALARDGSLVDDFVVSRTGNALWIRNAPSPAATAALPLARLIVDRAEEELNLG
jgi:(S)-2-hydroxyglutarate dehydrogenase